MRGKGWFHGRPHAGGRGRMLCCYLRVSTRARYFEARGMAAEMDVAPKTDTMTLAASVVAGYGIGLTGFAITVDVVTL
jgi:hypothetical protein